MNNSELPYRAVSVDPDRPIGDWTLTVCRMNNDKILYKAANIDLDPPSDLS